MNKTKKPIYLFEKDPFILKGYTLKNKLIDMNDEKYKVAFIIKNKRGMGM
jgi:hypothetical protein